MEPAQIGAKEIYDEVKGLQGQFNAFVLTQSVEMASVKKDIAALQAREGKSWQVKLALLSAFVSPVLAVSLPLIAR